MHTPCYSAFAIHFVSLLFTPCHAIVACDNYLLKNFMMMMMMKSEQSIWYIPKIFNILLNIWPTDWRLCRTK